MGSALITLRHVEKDYASGAGTVRALRDVSLAVEQGEFVAIVGTSGSGKSTLMNILGCLDRPTRGLYELGGFDVGARGSDARAVLRNRLIGFIFQGFNLLPRTTALENVELPLVYRGVGIRERRRLAIEALSAVGLRERAHHTPNQLSGGQQQRVAIARALVTQPPMLLADEPTGNLDTRTSLEVLALLQNLNRERGITIVLVTHEHDIAACASRVITFRDGRVVTDVAQDAPLDAAAELAGLADPNLRGGADEALSSDAKSDQASSRNLGSPIPAKLYGLSLVLGSLGALLGWLYSSLVLGLGQPPASILCSFGITFEVFALVVLAKRHFGRLLTQDQCIRVAIVQTQIAALLFGLLFAFRKLPGSAYGLEQLRTLSPVGFFGVVGVAIVALLVSALARYGFVTFTVWLTSSFLRFRKPVQKSITPIEKGLL